MTKKSVAPPRGSGSARPLARAVARTREQAGDSSDPMSRKARVAEVYRDLASPLNAIVGFASLLAECGDSLSPDKRRRYAAHIRDGGEALSVLVERLMRGLEGSGADIEVHWPSSGTFEVAPREATVAAHANPDSNEPIRAPDQGGAPVGRPGDDSRPVVLIADCDPSSRELMAAYLAGRGYDLLLAGCCAEALSMASNQRPDIVLLDPMMQDADGFETARQLKALSSDEFLPIVFVTTLVDDDSRLHALNVGAEQFVQKPVSRHELRARVKALVALCAQQRALAAQNVELKSLQRFKDDTTAMLVHDLKSPLSAMMMNLDFALGGLPASSEAGCVRDALEDCRVAGGRLFRMIANLLDIAKSDEGRLKPRRASVSVGALYDKVLEEYRGEADARKIRFVVTQEIDAPVSADPDLLERVIANLVDNALRYTRRSGVVRLSARLGERVELSVANDGPPISAESRRTIFEKYAHVSGSGGGSTMNRGLGLYFCRVAVEAHGGTISLGEDPDLPTCFRIELPRADAPTP